MTRLEQIKKNRESVFGSFTLAADIEWLIEQVEHLETVERHLKDFKQFEYEERMLNQKYEQALKFYAEREFDGEYAREALEETK